MTIPAASPTFVQIPGNGLALSFAAPMKCFQATDVVVGFIVGGVYVQQMSGFSITNIDNNGGFNVLFTIAPPLGTLVDIRTNTPQTQGTDFSNLGSYLPENTTESFDRVTRGMQDLTRVTYLFGLHGSDTESTPWPALPSASSRANTGLVFDANGLPSIGVLPAGTLTQSIFNGFLSAAGGATIGAPTSGPTITLQAASGWGALLAQSTIQVTGPGGLTNVNQNVNLTQLLFHGYAAEIVSINGSAGADLKVWSDVVDSAGTRHFRIENDALTATSDYFQVIRSGAFNGNQVTLAFPIGFGIVTMNPTALAGQYQMAIFAGAVAGFANGLEITAGSGPPDHAISVVNYNQTANLFQLRGDGSATFGNPIGGAMGAGTLNAQNLFINQMQVMAATPQSGWGTPTGAATVANFPGASASLVQTSTAVAAILAMIKQSGTITA